jgi:tRNA threonylcarbamoyladenosine biosynthesis protein TsaB
MLTLGIETATDVCAVALLDGDGAVFEAALHVPRAHGRRLAPLVAQALGHVGRAPGDLGLVAVSAGPGSYTGLRIGMGTAKGLCLATGAGLAAVPTLLALARGVAASEDETVVVALPSRRGEVYAAAYRDGAEARPATALAIAEAAAWLPDGPLAVAGPAAGRLAEAAPEAAWRRVDVAPSAARVARLGRERAGADGPTPLAEAEPSYLKPVVATRRRAIFGP